jgi:hypothetical protein
VWAGMPDPGETREELARSSDREAAALRGLLEGWPEVDPDGLGLTAAKLINRLEKSPDGFEVVRGAILELCPAPAGKLPAPRSVGNKLRHLRGRVVDGRAIDKRDAHGTAAWFVADVGPGGDSLCGPEGGTGCSGPGRSEMSSATTTPTDRSVPAVLGGPGAEQPDPPEQLMGSGSINNGIDWEEGEL